MRTGAIFLCFLCHSLVARDPLPASLTLEQGQEALREHIFQPKFARAQWGIKVISLDSGRVLFEANPEQLLKPASNAKIFTGALAVDLLGANFRFRTSIYSENRPNPDGKLEGDLVIYGRGDPTFAARFQDGSYTNLLGRVVQAIRSAGIKEIRGSLIGDETFITGPRAGASWTWDDLQYYYGAEVSALTLQENVVDLFLRPAAEIGEACRVSMKPRTVPIEFVNRTRTVDTNGVAAINVHRPVGENRVYISGSLPKNYGTFVDAVTVPNPARWFISTLRDALEKEGIRMHGDVVTRSWPQDGRGDYTGFRELAWTESVPLSEVLPKMLKPSQNLYAQLMFLQAGARSTNRALLTEDAAAREMSKFVQRAGIDPSEVLLDEGSGLSRACLVTPNAVVQLLQFMAKHPAADIFSAALPTPGEGTLRSRFPEWQGDAGSRVALKAKTGSIRYVTALSGYMRSADGDRLAFSILLNAYNPAAGNARSEIDTIIRTLARIESRAKNESALERESIPRDGTAELN